MRKLRLDDYETFFAVDLKKGYVLAHGIVESVERTGDTVLITYTNDTTEWARIGQPVAVYGEFIELNDDEPEYHDYEPNEGFMHPMSTEPRCRMCGERRTHYSHA